MEKESTPRSFTLFRKVYNAAMHLPAVLSGFLRGEGKLARSFRGRENWEKVWEAKITAINRQHGQKLIWLHAASLGEFEQASPVLAALRQTWPEALIVVTFFSPSGYEIRKSTPLADATGYLPWDTAYNAKKFVSILKPDLVIWVKYEYWFNHLNEIHRKRIPLLLVSAIFREGQAFFKWYGGLHKKALTFFSGIFVQNEKSKELISGLVPAERILVAGDTRFDTVVSLAQANRTFPGIAKIPLSRQPVLIAGSTWKEDEMLIQEFYKLHPEFNLILAPHEINEPHLREIENLFPEAIRYSKVETGAMPGKVLIIDSIGKLKHLYPYAHFAYIGGGFNKSGIHNTLEGAVYGLPVFFGPNYAKFAEAVGLIENKAAFSVSSGKEMASLISEILAAPGSYDQMAQNAARFVHKRAGATAKIIEYIQEKRLLTTS